MTSTHEADLNLPLLPPSACHIYIVSNPASASLISMRQLFDARCTIAFTATNVTISNNDTIILTGHRTPLTRLWHFTLLYPSPPPAPSNYTLLASIGSTTAPAKIIAFAHAALFLSRIVYPAPSPRKRLPHQLPQL
jgi:hypothetical protein